MDKLVIKGGKKLEGEVNISASKNSVLPILVATILNGNNCTIENAPQALGRMDMGGTNFLPHLTLRPPT